MSLVKTLLACSIATLVSLAQAQTAAPAPVAAPPAVAASEPAAAPDSAPSKGEAKAMREFKMLDFNGDGKLSRTEVKLFPRLSAAFDEADTNHDNYVSYEEVRAFAAKYRAERDRQKAEQAAQAHSRASGTATHAPEAEHKSE